MSQDFLSGFMAALVLMAICAAAYALYDSWVEHSDAIRVARWFEAQENLVEEESW